MKETEFVETTVQEQISFNTKCKDLKYANNVRGIVPLKRRG